MTNQDHGTKPEARRQASNCARCGRRISDPVSLSRGMDPVCWTESLGGLFERDLQASDEEWARREELLRKGGEIDLGVNWQYIDHDPNMALQFPQQMRVSVRFKDGAFEAYGQVSWGGLSREIVFLRSLDVQTAYAAAVQAGPASNAAAERSRRLHAQQLRQNQRRRVA
jgi:hypothetical protein